MNVRHIAGLCLALIGFGLHVAALAAWGYGWTLVLGKG